MKKNIIYSLLLALSLIGLQSCLHDDTKLFDKPTAVRLDQAVKETRELLEGADAGWQLNYYTGRNYSNGANTLLFKFKDGKVVIMGDNFGAEETATSTYDIVKDEGLVLSIDTYNKIIHPLTEASLGVPEGQQGDYEFIILRETPDSIFLRGKRWRNNMVLTRMNKDTNWESYMTELYKLKGALTSNSFHFMVDKDTLAEGNIDVNTNRLKVELQGVKYNIPFTFNDKGIELQSPLLVNGEKHTAFVWNAETNTFTSGNLSAIMFIPQGYKSIDFWYGTWTISFTNPSRQRLVVKLNLTPGNGKTFMKAQLNVHASQGRLSSDVSYNLLVAYNASDGTISIGAQSVTDPTGKFAGGIRLTPVATVGKKTDITEDGELIFKWDEELQQAVCVSAANESRPVNGLLGVGLADNLQPIVSEQGEAARAFFIPLITDLKNHKPLN